MAFEAGRWCGSCAPVTGSWSGRCQARPIADDAGWATATDELARAGLSLRPRPAWACLFANRSVRPDVAAASTRRQAGVPVYECQDDPRWGCPTPTRWCCCPRNGLRRAGFRRRVDRFGRRPGAGRRDRSAGAHPGPVRSANRGARCRGSVRPRATGAGAGLQAAGTAADRRGDRAGSWSTVLAGSALRAAVAERIVGWLAESGRALTRTTAGRGNVEIGWPIWKPSRPASTPGWPTRPRIRLPRRSESSSARCSLPASRSPGGTPAATVNRSSPCKTDRRSICWRWPGSGSTAAGPPCRPSCEIFARDEPDEARSTRGRLPPSRRRHLWRRMAPRTVGSHRPELTRCALPTVGSDNATAPGREPLIYASARGNGC